MTATTGSIRLRQVQTPGEWARFGWRYEDASGQSLLTRMDVVHVTVEGDIDEIVIFADSPE